MSTSAEALTWAWRQTMPKPIPPTGKYLLVALAGETHRVDGGPYQAAPGMAKLVSLTGLNESTVIRLLKQLAEAGFMTRERGVPMANGYRSKDVFTLPVTVAASVAGSKPARSKVASRQGGTVQAGAMQAGTTPPMHTVTDGAQETLPGTMQAGTMQGQVLKASSTDEVLKEHAASPRKRNDIFDAIATACDWDLNAITKSGASECGKAAAEIKAAGGTAAQVTLYARRYRREFGADIKLTPSALTKWWAKLASTGTEGARNDTPPVYAQ